MLWSKGTAAHCDVAGPPGYRLRATESCRSQSFFRRHYRRASGVVWLRTSGLARRGQPCDLDRFARAALPTIRRPFALVTTDGDASVPSDLRPDTVAALLQSPFLVTWRAQNYDGTPHPKLGPFPIGLDLHTPRPEGDADALARLLLDIRLRRPTPGGRRPRRVFTDVYLNPNSHDRRRVVARLSDSPLVDFATAKVSQAEIWRRYAEATFVLSVPGVGNDCHRTWEALYLGAIVIAKRSGIDALFANLPVALVDDWEEVGDGARLAEWYARYAPLTERAHIFRQLDPERWLTPVREAVAAASGRRDRRERRRRAA